MKNIWKNYKQTILLLFGLIIGAIIGIVYKEKAAILAPFGDIFMNCMFVIIVPLIFLTITTSIAKIKQPKRLGKVLTSIIGTFIIVSLIAATIGLISTYSFKLVDPKDSSTILEKLSTEEPTETEELNILERTVQATTVTDFSGILTRDNIIAIVIFSILIGIAINKVGEGAEPFLKVLESANKVIFKFVDIIFLYAPFGLGCYFAALIGTFGNEIAIGYAKTFVYYTIIALLFYFIVYSLYAFIAGGKKGFIAFWKNILPASATAISTCSSAASIPVNVNCTKKIGVSDDIAETMIPLGTSFHKDGSVIGSVFKIMFLVYLFGTTPSVGKVALVAIVATLLVTAVPVGGGTISETLILTMMGFPLTALPILTIIATIIDPPATLLNVVGDSASSMLTARIVDGKDWMNKKEKPNKTKKSSKN